jgi:hypothetical protein
MHKWLLNELKAFTKMKGEIIEGEFKLGTE